MRKHKLDSIPNITSGRRALDAISVITPGEPVGGWGLSPSTNPAFIPAFSPKRTDVNQYAIGDCWFLAKLINLADNCPWYIWNNLLRPQLDVPGDVLPGLYSAVFTDIHGFEVAIDIDSELDGVQAKPTTPNGAVWVALLEKAAAFFLTGSNNFQSLNSNMPYKAAFIFGLNDISVVDWSQPGAITDGNLHLSLAAKELICVCTNSVVQPPFVASHCYAMLSLMYQDKLSQGLYAIQNPWGDVAETEDQAVIYVTAAQIAANADIDAGQQPPPGLPSPSIPPNTSNVVPGGAPIISLVGSTATSSTTTKPPIPLAWQVAKGDTVTLSWQSEGGASAILRRTMQPDIMIALNGSLTFVATTSLNITLIVTAPDGQGSVSSFLMGVAA